MIARDAAGYARSGAHNVEHQRPRNRELWMEMWKNKLCGDLVVPRFVRLEKNLIFNNYIPLLSI